MKVNLTNKVTRVYPYSIPIRKKTLFGKISKCLDTEKMTEMTENSGQEGDLFIIDAASGYV